MSESATRAAIEATARNSYGRLIAYIAARSDKKLTELATSVINIAAAN